MKNYLISLVLLVLLISCSSLSTLPQQSPQDDDQDISSPKIPHCNTLFTLKKVDVFEKGVCFKGKGERLCVELKRYMTEGQWKEDALEVYLVGKEEYFHGFGPEFERVFPSYAESFSCSRVYWPDYVLFSFEGPKQNPVVRFWKKEEVEVINQIRGVLMEEG